MVLCDAILRWFELLSSSYYYHCYHYFVFRLIYQLLWFTKHLNLSRYTQTVSHSCAVNRWQPCSRVFRHGCQHSFTSHCGVAYVVIASSLMLLLAMLLPSLKIVVVAVLIFSFLLFLHPNSYLYLPLFRISLSSFLTCLLLLYWLFLFLYHAFIDIMQHHQLSDSFNNSKNDE